MSAEKLVRYKGYAIWIARDQDGIYFELTDLRGKDVYTSKENYVEVNDAVTAAQEWIDQRAQERGE